MAKVMRIKRYSDVVNENKMWYRTIPEMLAWLEDKSVMPWVWLDTETTGLGGPGVQQLTQVSGIATKYDFGSGFEELDAYDQKIKLDDVTKAKFLDPKDQTKKILGFNHYGSGDFRYRPEGDVLSEFFGWLSKYEPCLLVAQNAGFDMNMLAGRSGGKIVNEVFDTKMLIQLYYIPALQKLAETDREAADKLAEIGVSARDNGLVSSSLSRIGPVLGMDMAGYHDALTDCRLAMRMYEGMVAFLREHSDLDISGYQAERIKSIRGKLS